jgi:hypothetical protein
MLSSRVCHSLRIIGLKKLTKEDIQARQDARMRYAYVDPIEHFPDKIDQLLQALNRVGRAPRHVCCMLLIRISLSLSLSLAIYKSNSESVQNWR